MTDIHQMSSNYESLQTGSAQVLAQADCRVGLSDFVTVPAHASSSFLAACLGPLQRASLEAVAALYLSQRHQ